ncbi:MULTISPECIES: hypothetical protein [Streptomyces]|uniref:Uncharacterized protein n=1 Tax=Streptomyces kasugaensis TaxID=1946 RepID=A0A4Q9HZI1_STRKA|nr:hypothetical protein [Streptomyces kasugaensis]TBO60733.1 hypothetical protein EYS09_04985 [Streptomyces kasugaensis]
MNGIYALISPDGSLVFRDGVPDHMRKDADPHHGAPSAFAIRRPAWGGHGLQCLVGGTSTLQHNTYPPNHIGAALVEGLDGPDQYIFGNLTICGSRTASATAELEMCGLTDAQQRLISAVHAAVADEAASSP